MTVLLVFALTLLLAVLVSDLARRSVLSTAVLFLATGIVLGGAVVGLLDFKPNHPIEVFLEIALFVVLFSDGMHVGLRELSSAWRLPGRALLLGMPLTFLITALLAFWLTEFDGTQCFLLAAALSPTDPVLVTAITGREEVPLRLRRLLNVESGLNDGLALPVVLFLLAGFGEKTAGVTIVSELTFGILLGLILPWAAIQMEKLTFFTVHSDYHILYAIALGLLVLSISSLTHANSFLAAFFAGVMIASTSADMQAAFQGFGAILTELFKLAGLLVFGALISSHMVLDFTVLEYALAFLILFLARPAGLLIALMGSQLDWQERAAAAWFGPKGFASAVLALLILRSSIPLSTKIFDLISLVIVGSIVLHSSTDVLVARWFHKRES